MASNQDASEKALSAANQSLAGYFKQFKKRVVNMFFFTKHCQFRMASLVSILFVGVASAEGALEQVANLNKIYDYIAESEYHIRWFGGEGTLKAANRSQNLRFSFFADGFGAEPRVLGEFGDKPWEFQIALLGFGKDPAVQSTADDGQWSSRDNQATSVTDRINIAYKNGPDGMRQDFLIKEKPIGDQPLELTFHVQAQGLSFNVKENGVEFLTGDGTLVARYNDLHVFDASGAEIPAMMMRKNPEQFVIVVDDSTATYPILVDPLTTSVKVYNEGEAGSKFSYSVARYDWIGNNDYPGIVVGAPYFDTGLYAAAGKVFAFFAFSSLPSTPTWEKEGDQANAHFGWCVASPGDVDGNFYNDVLVGAPHYDAGGYTDNGRAFLFNGSLSGISATASWAEGAYQSYALAGYAVSGVGDFNGDSYDDFAFGVPYYDYTSPGSNDGYVSIYKGSGSGPALLTTSIGNGHSLRGFSIAPTGDVDNDGNDDFVVGAPTYNTGTAIAGAAERCPMEAKECAV